MTEDYCPVAPWSVEPYLEKGSMEEEGGAGLLFFSLSPLGLKLLLEGAEGGKAQ